MAKSATGKRRLGRYVMFSVMAKSATWTILMKRMLVMLCPVMVKSATGKRMLCM